MEWICGCGGSNRDEARFCNQCGAPKPAEAPAPVVPTPQPAVVQREPEAAPPPIAPAFASEPTPAAVPRKSRAPIIIAIIAAVVLLGTCLLGIIAAIAIPNFLSAAQRAKQRRAMAEVRTIAAACQLFAVDKGAYPDTGHNADSYYAMVDVTDLKPLLVPGYAQVLPEKDPWDHPYKYGVSAENKEFVVICAGADGIVSVQAIPTEFTGTSCFEDDIVWENDKMVQAPEGKQKHCGKQG